MTNLGKLSICLDEFARRPTLRRFDAFRSIFPAGTVSGAPKIKAVQLISGLEKERRGVYAGAVGRFDFDRDNLDTCIAIRTMTFKDGKVFLQAGGGIVFDSVEEDEFVETINKLGANVKCIEEAESESIFIFLLCSGFIVVLIRRCRVLREVARTERVKNFRQYRSP